MAAPDSLGLKTHRMAHDGFCACARTTVQKANSHSFCVALFAFAEFSNLVIWCCIDQRCTVTRCYCNQLNVTQNVARLGSQHKALLLCKARQGKRAQQAAPLQCRCGAPAAAVIAICTSYKYTPMLLRQRGRRRLGDTTEITQTTKSSQHCSSVQQTLGKLLGELL